MKNTKNTVLPFIAVCSHNAGGIHSFDREANRKDTHMPLLKNILLIYPTVPGNTYWSFRYALPFIKKKSALSPLGLITVAALIPDEYQLKLVDMKIRSRLEISRIFFAAVDRCTAMRSRVHGEHVLMPKIV